MAKVARVGIFLMLLLVVFCFAGCSWFDSGGLTPGTGEGEQSFPDDRYQTGDKEYPGMDWDSSEYTAQDNEDRASATQAVRATYTEAFETTDDAELQADRDKFNKNAALQYEIVAYSILYYLVGNYGYIDGQTGENLNYIFYADTSYLTHGEQQSATVSLPVIKPFEADDLYLDGHDGAIEHTIAGLAGEYTYDAVSDSGTWSVERVYETQYRWNFNLDSEVTSSYNQNFINEFLPYVQINLMEYGLGHELTPVSQLMTLAPSQLDALIHDYVGEIDKLGIIANQEYSDFLYNYIMDTIIGENALSREGMTFVYDEPSDTYTIALEPDPDNPDAPTEEVITVYYDVDGNPDTHSFTSSAANGIYKYDYENTVREIADIIAGTYDAGGNELTPAISAEFPTYTRLEMVDVSPDLFYTEGEEAEEGINRLNNMPYMEYESVIIYPDGQRGADENFETVIDYDNKVWQFDYVNFYVDSVSDLTLDIYLRLHIDGADYIAHVTRIQTDGEQGFDYAPSFAGEGDNNSSGSSDEADDSDTFFPDYQSNVGLTYAPLFLPDHTDTLATGIENTSEVSSYAESGEYKSLFVGKLGQSTEYDKTTFTVTNHYGEDVEINLTLCTSDDDFVEYIFVPDKSQGDDYDYRFKFMIKDSYWGSVSSESEGT